MAEPSAIPRIDEQRAFRDTFVYEAEAANSPFAVFLAHTDEKDVVGGYLGARIAAFGERDIIRILDIGCGDASLASVAIAKSGVAPDVIAYDGIDPVAYNVQRARRTLQVHGIAHTIDEVPFESSQPSGPYDIVIASNLYHLATAEVPPFLERTRKLLGAWGVAFFAYRGSEDDILDFRRRFEAPLYDDFREPRTIDHVVEACQQAGFSYDNLEEVGAQLAIPDDDSLRAKIVEFILNMPATALGEDYLADIYTYFERRHNVLRTAQAVLSFSGAEQDA